MITTDAQPDPMMIDPSRAAVIVVDMQNDFGAEGGMFARVGIDIAAIRGRDRCHQQRAHRGAPARDPGRVPEDGLPTRSLRRGTARHATWLKHLPLGAGDRVTAPDGSESRVLIRDSWNTDIVDELAPENGDIVLYKHRYSGFYETDLDAELRRRGIQSLIFTGCTTSVCVESTLRDAMFRDYHCLLLEDCTAEPVGNDLPRTNHDASLLVVRVLLGRTARSEDLALGRQLARGPATITAR